MGNLNDYSALDVIATLTELTAQSIAHAVAQFSRNQPELYVCGGGVHNQYLMGRIQSLLPSTAVRSTAHKGIDRKSTRLNSSHVRISYAVFCLKKKKKKQ